MNLTRTILAGIAGTFLMTAFMYAMTYLTDRVMKVVKILGTLLTFRTGRGENYRTARYPRGWVYWLTTPSV